MLPLFKALVETPPLFFCHVIYRLFILQTLGRTWEPRALPSSLFLVTESRFDIFSEPAILPLQAMILL
jgi:hypothetical protein